MTERSSQTYKCYSKGCAKGYESLFTAAPEAWFTAKGFTPPKNCPECRAWIQKQADEATWCASCKCSMRIPALYKISHHKRTGTWTLPDECQRCKRGLKPATNVNERPQREKTLEIEEDEDDDFAKMPQGIPVEPRTLITDLATYQRDVFGANGVETRQVHLERHMPGSPHSQVGQTVNGRLKTRTAFVDTTSSDTSELLANLAHELTKVAPDAMREYEQGNRIVRVTLLADGDVEETVLQRQQNGDYLLVTTYDTVAITDAVAQYKKHGR